MVDINDEIALLSDLGTKEELDSKVTPRSNAFCDLVAASKSFGEILGERQQKMARLEELFQEVDKSLKKTVRRALLHVRTAINKDTNHFQMQISNRSVDRMHELEVYKQDGYLPDLYAEEIRNLYILLTEQGRTQSRYVKLPKEWVRIGAYGGILEDLVVIMRTPSQIGLGNKHLFSTDEILDGYRRYMIDKEEKEGCPRFLFFHLLVLNNSDKAIGAMLADCVLYQGNSKRIGTLRDEQNTYYYAIQGVYGGIRYDDRVARTLAVDMYEEKSQNMCRSPPIYAVHFTKNEIAYSIWNKLETSSTRPRANGKPIVVGHICKFDRAIHALTNVEKSENGKFRLVTTDKNIRDRMVHGLKTDVKRFKYESGLIIDLVKLCKTLEPGSIQINEIGTMLAHDDIPHDCLLYHISSEEDIEYFWGL